MGISRDEKLSGVSQATATLVASPWRCRYLAAIIRPDD
jgi:hypothetical protein